LRIDVILMFGEEGARERERERERETENEAPVDEFKFSSQLTL